MMRMTIASKLFLGFLVVIFLNLFFIVTVSKIEALNSIANMLKRQNEIKHNLSRLKSLHKVQGLSAYSFEHIGESESISNFKEINATIEHLFDTITGQLQTIVLLDSLIAEKSWSAQEPNKTMVLPKYVYDAEHLNATYHSVFDSIVAFKSNTAQNKPISETLFKNIKSDFNVIDKQFLSNLDSAQFFIDEQTKYYLREVENGIYNVRQITLLILTGMSIFAIFFGFFFSRAITNSLRRLKESATTIGKGNFKFNPKGYPKDEIGDLAKAFHKMSADLQRTQEELVKSKRLAAIGEVVASVNHEINNPLMIISGNAQFLDISMENFPQEMRDRIRTILEETERISKVTRKLREIKNPIIEDYTSNGEQFINIEKSAN